MQCGVARFVNGSQAGEQGLVELPEDETGMSTHREARGRTIMAEWRHRVLHDTDMNTHVSRARQMLCAMRGDTFILALIAAVCCSTPSERV